MTDQVVDMAVVYGVVRITLLSGGQITVPKAVFRLHPLKAGDSLIAEAYWQSIAKDAYELGMQKAVRALTARERTEKELVRSLSRSGYRAETIASILTFLRDRRYVDDTRYADQMARTMQHKHSARRIAQSMQHKGIGRETMTKAMEHVQNDAQDALLRQLAQAYLRRHPDLSTPEARNKATAHLVRKGFSFDSVRDVLREYQDGEYQD